MMHCGILQNIRSWCGCSLLAFVLSIPVAHVKASEDIGSVLLEHVADAHTWHLATIDNYHIALPLPIILYSKDRGLECFLSSRFYDKHHKLVPYNGYYMANEKISCADPHRIVYDFSITKNVAAMFFSILLLVGISLYAASKYYRNPLMKPKGVSLAIELVMGFIIREIALPNIGKEHYAKFVPYLTTTFLFIWLNNMLGLLPGGANVTGNISVTLVLATFTILITMLSAKKTYWSHMLKPEGVPVWLYPIMVPVEILGIFTKYFSLMIRLFANITAGHIVLLSIIALVFIMGSVYVGLGISLPFGVFMLTLKVLVALLQAYVFTLLSAIYFGQAVHTKHD